ncbi:MAG: metallophosphoesterase family protein, partial [Candidatus Paceibacterota bacterium]
KALTILRNKDAKNVDFAPESHRELDLPEGKVFLSHFPILAQNAAKSGEYKACFYGDDHMKYQTILSNGTLLANPGEIAGTRTGQPSFGIWDADSNTFEIIDLTDFKVAK